MASKRPNYGIDAPGIRRGMLIAGAGGLAVAVGAKAFGPPSGFYMALTVLGLVIAVYGFFMGSYMTYGSLIGKLRRRDMLLDLVGQVRPWTGGEQVLDVGCGRGLMMIGAAKRLTSGVAIGIDLWRAEDQSGNSAEAAHANTECETVSDRVRIDTGDARDLPYDRASFDIVMSHWVVHNLQDAADRRRVLEEMLRVLRPGGVLVLADIANCSDYRDFLMSQGLREVHFIDGGAEAAIMGTLSGGSYRPQALVMAAPLN